jgi:hypothetical protein
LHVVPVTQCRWALEAVIIQRMQAAVRASQQEAAPTAVAGHDSAALADEEREAAVEAPLDADVQLTRVQQMRVRMRRQLATQLACTQQNRVFLNEELDLTDAQQGVGAFVSKYPPTINAGGGADVVCVCVMCHLMLCTQPRRWPR